MPLDRISFLLGGNAFFIYFVVAGILLSFYRHSHKRHSVSHNILAYRCFRFDPPLSLFKGCPICPPAHRTGTPLIYPIHTLFISIPQTRILHRKTLQATKSIGISLKSALIIIYLSSVLIP